MDIKINQMQQVNQVTQGQQAAQTDDTFKFMLASSIEDSALQERLTLVMEDIIQQGKRLGKHMDVRDMKRYRMLIKEFMNEVVNRSHKFSRENFLDRKGRHRVYGIVKLVDERLDELAQELIKDEKDHIEIRGRVDEIQGLL